jgi:hypothetical protein
MINRVNKKEIAAGTAKTIDCSLRVERNRSVVNITENAMKG